MKTEMFTDLCLDSSKLTSHQRSRSTSLSAKECFTACKSKWLSRDHCYHWKQVL